MDTSGREAKKSAYSRGKIGVVVKQGGKYIVS